MIKKIGIIDENNEIVVELLENQGYLVSDNGFIFKKVEEKDADSKV